MVAREMYITATSRKMIREGLKGCVFPQASGTNPLGGIHVATRILVP